MDWRQEGGAEYPVPSALSRSDFARSNGYGTQWPAAAGSALLLVLFAIILLSGLITATVAFVSNDVDEYGALNKEFRARQLAESGLAFGIDPQVKNQDQGVARPGDAGSRTVPRFDLERIDQTEY